MVFTMYLLYIYVVIFNLYLCSTYWVYMLYTQGSYSTYSACTYWVYVFFWSHLSTTWCGIIWFILNVVPIGYLWFFFSVSWYIPFVRKEYVDRNYILSTMKLNKTKYRIVKGDITIIQTHILSLYSPLI